MLAGSTLQDDIATTTRQLVTKGYDILGMVPGVNFERFHDKTYSQSATSPQSFLPNSVGSITGWVARKIISSGVITPVGRFTSSW